MDDKRHDPGDGHLKREHGNGVARAQLALDGADGRHAGRIQQRKDQEHIKTIDDRPFGMSGDDYANLLASCTTLK